MRWLFVGLLFWLQRWNDIGDESTDGMMGLWDDGMVDLWTEGMME